MKRTSLFARHLLWIFLLAFVAGCGRDNDRIRLLETIKRQNDLLEDEFHENAGLLQRDLVEGHPSLQPHLFRALQPAFDYNLRQTVEFLEKLNLLNAENMEKGLLDSLAVQWSDFEIQLLKLGCGDGIGGQFCEEWQKRSENPFARLAALAPEDTAAIREELALARAAVLEHGHWRMDAIDHHIRAIVCHWGNHDTLTIYDVLEAASVTAGDTARTTVSVAVSNGLTGLEFSGSHPIRPNANYSAATMEIPTSESMIPPGQSSAELPYSATVKVPKADGSIEELRLVGKIPITRPCR